MSAGRALWRAWGRLQESRVKVERATMFAIYLTTFVMGAAACVVPPTSMEGTIGSTLTYVWGGLLMVCGAFGAYGVLPGLWWAERIAVRAGVTGAAIYAAVVASLHVTQPGNRIPQACAVLIVVLVFIGRAYTIRGINYEPRPEERMT